MSRLTNRDRVLVFSLAVVGVLTAAPGVHLFKRFLPDLPAVLISHGIALALVATAIFQWYSRRARPNR